MTSCRYRRLPTDAFAREKAPKFNGSSIGLKYYGPAHTQRIEDRPPRGVGQGAEQHIMRGLHPGP